jgi:hypothetical protein
MTERRTEQPRKEVGQQLLSQIPPVDHPGKQVVDTSEVKSSSSLEAYLYPYLINLGSKHDYLPICHP